MSSAGSLVRRLSLLISAGFAVIWVLAIVATALVLRYEQEELADLELRQNAEVLLPILARDYRREGRLDDLPGAGGNPAEMLVYQLIESSGQVLAQSLEVEEVSLPEGPAVAGFSRTRTHIYYTTPPDSGGIALRFGDSRLERHEAYRDSMIAFLLPMLALLPLAYFLVGAIARAALRPLQPLRAEIAQRSGGRLDPIDAADQPEELRPITTALNAMMARLAQTLEGERAFATNAAHELRTPVNVALAQVQRLRAEISDPVAGASIQRAEAALKRLGRLVARLLQLARAEAGIGLTDAPQDVARLLDLVLDDSRRDPARSERLRISQPTEPVWSRMDPDAFAIVAGNLIDNAFQHATPGTPITVALHPDGTLSIGNDAPLLSASDLDRIRKRYRQGGESGQGVKPRSGFGLGLYISDTIARQAGGTLDLLSPRPGQESGFEARFQVPLAASDDNR